MEIVSKRNFIVLIAALLVVAFGLMSLYLNKKTNQPAPAQTATYEGPEMSDSDEIDAIQKDLGQTDIDSMEKDLIEVEKELQNY